MTGSKHPRAPGDRVWGNKVFTVMGIDPGPDRSAFSIVQFPTTGRPSVVRWFMQPSNPKHILAVLEEEVDLVAVERIVLLPGRTSNAIRDTCETSGAIQWLAISQGHRVVTPTVSEWRRKICGRKGSSATPGDQAVSEMLGAWLEHLPPNVHLRDATGIALYGGAFGRWL